jgi:DNA polymerase III delta prime subunit
MMPPYCPQSAPPGEKELFNALAAGADTEGWIVLHSLGIADHVRQVEGEADFVVIVPGLGVLVIEVKSHLSVTRLADGTWRLGSQRPTARSPFQQAQEAMYSLRQYLLSRNVNMRSVPLCYAVWFTGVRARADFSTSPEWHDWQVLDSEDLRAGATAAIVRALRAGGTHLASKRFPGEEPVPSEAIANRIASVLRPKFEVATTAGDRRRDRETKLLAFIDEQYAALDAMQDNHAVLFTGPAGSGKTLLAIEAARREVAQGGTGRLLCFNRLLGHRIAADIGRIPGLTVSTLHQEMLRLAGTEVPEPVAPAFWEKMLPELASYALLESDSSSDDFLVIDEVQDIARPGFLDVLDLLVKGGLRDGRLLLFGDFERQAIFESSDGRALLRSRITNLVAHRLTCNCRNLPRIGHLVNVFSGLDPGYQRFRRQDDGTNPTFIPYKAGDDASPKLVQAINTLRTEGFALNEITVLSPLGSDSVSQATTDPWLRRVLRPATGGLPRPGTVQYSTIHAFKGLEAPAVVVTDLERNLIPNFESLLYVGLTRATDRLIVVMDRETFKTMSKGI